MSTPIACIYALANTTFALPIVRILSGNFYTFYKMQVISTTPGEEFWKSTKPNDPNKADAPSIGFIVETQFHKFAKKYFASTVKKEPGTTSSASGLSSSTRTSSAAGTAPSALPRGAAAAEGAWTVPQMHL